MTNDKEISFQDFVKNQLYASPKFIKTIAKELTKIDEIISQKDYINEEKLHQKLHYHFTIFFKNVMELTVPIFLKNCDKNSEIIEAILNKYNQHVSKKTLTKILTITDILSIKDIALIEHFIRFAINIINDPMLIKKTIKKMSKKDRLNFIRSVDCNNKVESYILNRICNKPFDKNLNKNKIIMEVKKYYKFTDEKMIYNYINKAKKIAKQWHNSQIEALENNNDREWETVLKTGTYLEQK